MCDDCLERCTDSVDCWERQQLRPICQRCRRKAVDGERWTFIQNQAGYFYCSAQFSASCNARADAHRQAAGPVTIPLPKKQRMCDRCGGPIPNGGRPLWVDGENIYHFSCGLHLDSGPGTTVAPE